MPFESRNVVGPNSDITVLISQCKVGGVILQASNGNFWNQINTSQAIANLTNTLQAHALAILPAQNFPNLTFRQIISQSVSITQTEIANLSFSDDKHELSSTFLNSVPIALQDYPVGIGWVWPSFGF